MGAVVSKVSMQGTLTVVTDTVPTAR
jgi:hypothetical protein